MVEDSRVHHRPTPLPSPDRNRAIVFLHAVRSRGLRSYPSGAWPALHPSEPLRESSSTLEALLALHSLPFYLGKLPALSNLTDSEPLLFYALHLQDFLQPTDRCHHLLFRQHPRAPVDAHRPLGLDGLEDLYGVSRVAVLRRHDPARVVGADGDEREVEGTAVLADLRKGGAGGEVGKVGGPVVDGGGELGDGAEAGVAAEPDGMGGWRRRRGG